MDTSDFKLEYENVSKKVLLTGPKFQTKLRICPGRAPEIYPLSMDKRPIAIGHNMSMVRDTRKSNFGSQ